MTKPLSLQDIKDLHKEKFGVEPVITGELFWSDIPVGVRILDAIEAGKPYIEEEVPKGRDI